MNERIQELELEAAYGNIDPNGPFTPEEFNNFTAKFAELILLECTQVLFNESERLYERSTVETGWQNSRDYEMCSDNCMDNIAALERHFGIE